MKIIQEKLESLSKHKVLREKEVPLFMGNPGLGKTTVIKKFASDNNKQLVTYLASSKSPIELSGMTVPDWDKKIMTIFDFDRLTKLNDGDILFFDEVPQAMLPTLNALLVLLDTRMMESGKELADIIIVAAGNYQGMGQMTPQVKDRFIWFDVKFDETMWIDYMFNKYNLSKESSLKLCKLIQVEDFKGYNFMTPRSIDKAVMSMCYNSPTPYSSKLESILNKTFKNESEHPMRISKNKALEIGEEISWLKLKQYQYEVIS